MEKPEGGEELAEMEPLAELDPEELLEDDEVDPEELDDVEGEDEEDETEFNPKAMAKPTAIARTATTIATEIPIFSSKLNGLSFIGVLEDIDPKRNWSRKTTKRDATSFFAFKDDLIYCFHRAFLSPSRKHKTYIGERTPPKILSKPSKARNRGHLLIRVFPSLRSNLVGHSNSSGCVSIENDRDETRLGSAGKCFSRQDRFRRRGQVEAKGRRMDVHPSLESIQTENRSIRSNLLESELLKFEVAAFLSGLPEDQGDRIMDKLVSVQSYNERRQKRKFKKTPGSACLHHKRLHQRCPLNCSRLKNSDRDYDSQ